jgi:hypothetical protein
MSIAGTVSVRCPSCGRSHEAKLVQSINARDEPALVEQLIAGELNVLACTCGRRTLLEATLLFHDPEREYFCQACPGGEDAMAAGARAFASIAGVAATRRLVPSHNALLEKVLILRAGLDDAVIEVLKVLLLLARRRPRSRAAVRARRSRGRAPRLATPRPAAHDREPARRLHQAGVDEPAQAGARCAAHRSRVGHRGRAR